MNAPICEFVSKYAVSKKMRLHMPGHKGNSFLGYEMMDITEFEGADALYIASGIIKESEENATSIFESGASYYSCEGSTLSVKAMCHLAKKYAVSKGQSANYILATKNAHSSFVSASILLDFDIMWLCADEASYLSGKISADEIEKVLSCVDNLPFAVYITSPDYLGNICDIKSISRVCKRYGIPLLVDNAHGAYLKFLDDSTHPIDLGATLVCDSAHKTLPTITGGGYLHISKDAPAFFKENAKESMALFGTTSPSYLILCSLDNTNIYLTDGYKEKLSRYILKVDELRDKLTDGGYTIIGDERLKLTIKAKDYGYLGSELYSILYRKGIVCEFYDKDFLVMMLTPENGEDALNTLLDALLSIPKKDAILDTPPHFSPCKQVLSPKMAHFSPSEIIDIDAALGRVMAGLCVSCPPAVSVISSGEEFNQSTIALLKYYGITKCKVVK